MTEKMEIIAEAGSNHNGDVAKARALIDLAARAKASSVKFQFIFSEGLYLPEFFDGENYVPNPVFVQRQREEMPESDWREIWSHAHKQGMPVSASVFCIRGVELLRRLGAPYVKVASTDLTNHTLIGHACGAFERVIISTGMASMAEIDATVRFVRSHYPQTNLELMHCVSVYPCPLYEANTKRVELLRRAFDLPVGYSDHTSEDLSAAMALVHGASFFEKHFTLDRSLPGFDHAHALDEAGLTSYVQNLCDAASSLTQSANRTSQSEAVTKIRARRGVYAARDLPKGHVIQREDLLFVRPSTEFQGNEVSSFVGQELTQDTPRFSALAIGSGVRIVASNWQSAKDYWGTEMKEKGLDTGISNREKGQ